MDCVMNRDFIEKRDLKGKNTKHIVNELQE